MFFFLIYVLLLFTVWLRTQTFGPSYNDVAELAYPGLPQGMKKLIFDRKLGFEWHFFCPHLFSRMALEPPFSWCCSHYSVCVFVSEFFTPRNNRQYLSYCKTSLLFYILIFCIALRCCFSQNALQISLSVFWHLPTAFCVLLWLMC